MVDFRRFLDTYRFGWNRIRTEMETTLYSFVDNPVVRFCPNP